MAEVCLVFLGEQRWGHPYEHMWLWLTEGGSFTIGQHSTMWPSHEGAPPHGQWTMLEFIHWDLPFENEMTKML